MTGQGLRCQSDGHDVRRYRMKEYRQGTCCCLCGYHVKNMGKRSTVSMRQGKCENRLQDIIEGSAGR